MRVDERIGGSRTGKRKTIDARNEDKLKRRTGDGFICDPWRLTFAGVRKRLHAGFGEPGSRKRDRVSMDGSEERGRDDE